MKKQAKRRNPADTTQRNNRARKKEIAELHERIDLLAHILKQAAEAFAARFVAVKRERKRK